MNSNAEKHELIGHYTDVGETRTYYEMVGDVGAPPVVCVHTAGAEGRQWRYVAPSLAERGYRVVIPDLPGHGKTYPVDWEPHTSIHQHADFIWQLIERLDLDSPAVVGCSIGGNTALDLAVHHADDLRCAVAMEGAARTRGAPLGRLAHPHACPGWQDVLRYSVVDSTGDSCPTDRRVELDWQHRGSQQVATSDLQGWADFDVRAHLDRATCPVLLVRGDDDFYVQDDVFDETVKHLPDCEAVVLEGTGHYPMMERPEETTDLVAQFLGEH